MKSPTPAVERRNNENKNVAPQHDRRCYTPCIGDKFMDVNNLMSAAAIIRRALLSIDDRR
jgi:hypothetical protein